MGTIQIISILATTVFLCIVLEAVRRCHLKAAYSLLWLILGFIFLLLAVWREALDMISSIIGIAYSPTALFLFMLCALFLISFQFSILLTRRSEEIRIIAQNLAFLEARLRAVETELAKREAAPKGETSKSSSNS